MREKKIETLFLSVFLFDGSNQRTNMDAGGGYHVITVL